MDISKLALLCDIADTNNLTASAERMGYTQSGLTLHNPHFGNRYAGRKDPVNLCESIYKAF